ncbi:hypothetical protein T484DRAFT_1783608, partial [Baffinella frigidus]
ASLKATRTKISSTQSGVILVGGSDSAVPGLAPRTLNQFSSPPLPPCARGWAGAPGGESVGLPAGVRAEVGKGGVVASGKDMEKRWRGLKGDDAGRYALLLSVSASTLSYKDLFTAERQSPYISYALLLTVSASPLGFKDLFKAELDATLLSEAVAVLASHTPHPPSSSSTSSSSAHASSAAGGDTAAGPPQDGEESGPPQDNGEDPAGDVALGLLEDMAQAGRFALNVRFLGKGEKAAVRVLLDGAKARGGALEARALKVASAYLV